MKRWGAVVWCKPFKFRVQVRAFYDNDETSSIGWYLFGETFENYRTAQRFAQWIRRNPYVLS